MFQYILPEYIDNRGDCSRLKVDDEETVLDREVNLALRYLFKERFLDLDVIRKRCSHVVNQQHLIPLYLGKDEIIIPVKVRKPRAKWDSVRGYINVNYIDKIQEWSVILKDKTCLTTLECKRCLTKRTKAAKLVAKDFDENESMRPMLKGDMECTATREDVALVLMEIERIERELKRKIM